jgi:antitoxin component YwqK of YwqJK toxin-antitoxin module
MEETEINQYNENNKRDGEWKYYYENEKLKIIGNYKEGEKVGEWRYYDEEGKLRKIEYFDD